ncbi:MAG: DoxX family protein [Ilumatobacteraceae bacterium]
MNVIVLIGRILFGMLFLSSGFAHIRKRTAMSQYAGYMKVPAPFASTIVSGLLIMAGGLMVIFGVWADLGALLLFAFLIPTAFLMHAFWKIEDPQQSQMDMAHFMKDIALAGAALIAFALFAHIGTDLGLTITGPLFKLT